MVDMLLEQGHIMLNEDVKTAVGENKMKGWRSEMKGLYEFKAVMGIYSRGSLGGIRTCTR